MPKVITIDGGAGTGKTTLAGLLATRLKRQGISAIHFSSGLLYRLLAVIAQNHSVLCYVGDELNATKLLFCAENMNLTIRPDGRLVLLDLVVEDESLRNNVAAGEAASKQIAVSPEVREYVNGKLKAFAEQSDYKYVIFDGRDMGSTVFPGAFLKIFLTVDESIAAARQDTTAEAIRDRDVCDSNRSIAPLAAAPDALTLDTSHINKEEVLDWTYERFAEKYVQDP